MNLTEATKTLESLGTTQNRKVYGRHGVTGERFGVSYANLGVLKKQIGVDHALAEQLWRTENHDARVLATMVADPRKITSSTLDAWAKDLDSYVITNALSSLVSRTSFARAKFIKWSRSRGEWIGSAGWEALAYLAGMDDELPDQFFIQQLGVIEREIENRLNRVRHAMNQALIAIGGRNATLRRRACAAARRIGPVAVDHGETGCKTPEAVGYIDKMWKHKEMMAARKAARATKRGKA